VRTPKRFERERAERGLLLGKHRGDLALRGAVDARVRPVRLPAIEVRLRLVEALEAESPQRRLRRVPDASFDFPFAIGIADTTRERDDAVMRETELINVTQDDISRYVDLACAEEGIPLLPEQAPIAPDAEAVADDMTVYEIAGILFPRREDAQKVCDLVATLEHGSTNYISGPSYRQKYEPTEGDSVSVQTRRLLSPQKAASLKGAILVIERAKKEYQDTKKEYDRIVEARAEIVTRIDEAVRKAQSAQWRRDGLMKEYQRYLDLAQGIKTIALRFLEAARPESRELLPALFAPDAAGAERVYALSEP
jgi:hypothetical protein